MGELQERRQVEGAVRWPVYDPGDDERNLKKAAAVGRRGKEQKVSHDITEKCCFFVFLRLLFPLESANYLNIIFIPFRSTYSDTFS